MNKNGLILMMACKIIFVVDLCLHGVHRESFTFLFTSITQTVSSYLVTQILITNSTL